MTQFKKRIDEEPPRQTAQEKKYTQKNKIQNSNSDLKSIKIQSITHYIEYI